MKLTGFRTLVDHFVRTIVAPPILTDLGVDFLRRTIASVTAILLVIGIFLPRSFFKKYVDLGGQIYPDAYLRALQADTLLMIAVPMLLVALLAVVLSPLLFPDEIDYQVLTPLPISRATLFGAKLVALMVVVFVAVLAVTTIASVWFPMVSGGKRAPHPALDRIAAHAVATVAGSAWAFSAVMALQGLCLIVLPATWRRRTSVAVQAVLFLALLLAIPFVMRIPSLMITGDAVLSRPLVLLPPVWFYGFEQWWLDGTQAGGYATVARLAAIAAMTTVLLIAASYAVLYRSAERLAGFSDSRRGCVTTRPSIVGLLEQRALVRPATAGVMAFAVTGLTRSRLHQFVFVLIVGAGSALLASQVMAVAEGATSLSSQPRAVHAALAAPLLVTLSVVLGLRQVFLLPIDRDAAWVFRVTEDRHMRTAALDAVAHLFTAAALIPAWLMAAVVQPAVLGSAWIVALLLTTLVGLLLTEIILSEWARIPFTCSYLPGKRVFAYTLGVLFASYASYVYLGAHVLRWSVLHPARAVIVGGLLVAAFGTLRRTRMKTRGLRPLEFEDSDPLAVRTLGLLPDER